MHAYEKTHIDTYIRTYIHTYIHTYVHTYIHTYIHTIGLSDATVFAIYHDTKELSISRYLLNNNRNSFDTLLIKFFGGFRG